MARPRTEVGTYGDIKTKEISPGVWEARARFRMKDGSMKRPSRTGSTSNAAERALKKHMVRLADETAGRKISGDTRMTHIADLWLAEVEKDVRRGTLAHNTYETYAGRVKNWVKPKIGELTANETTVTVVDDVIQDAWDQVSYATAKSVRVVLGGVCGYAVIHGAMDANPVRSAKRLSSGDAKDVLSLEPEQRVDLLAKLEQYGREHVTDAQGRRLGPRGKIWRDIPSLMEAMLSTGGRIGEVLALDADSVDPASRTVALDHHLVRVKGKGIQRVRKRKGRGRELLLKVPEWSVSMWRERKLASGGGPLYSSWSGGWLDPSNVTKDIRKACDAVGYEWVSSHIFRKTVGTHLDREGISPTATADQLGNTPAVVEKHYRGKRVANAETADALESMMTREGTA